MGLDDKSLKVVMGTNTEGMEDTRITDYEVCSERELGDSRNRYCELEERTKKAEERCVVLEVEAQKTKNEFELLAGRFRALEVEKIAVEDELRDLKKRNGALEEVINKFDNENAFANEKESGKGVMVDLTVDKDNDEKFQLMIENRVLDCEKKRAESEVEVWKSRCRELESRVLELRNTLVLRGGEFSFSELLEMAAAKGIKGASGLEDRLGVKTSLEHVQMEGNAVSGTFWNDTPSKKSTHVGGRKRGAHSETEQESGGLVQKQLEFGEGSPSKKIAPPTPGGARPLGVIDISDSDDERDNEKEMTCNNKLKRIIPDQSDEDVGGYNGNFTYSTPKRKRASNIVTSDSESDDDDDNIPICKLRRKHLSEFYSDHTDSYLKSCSGTVTVSGDEAIETVTPGRRLVRLRKRVVKGDPERLSPSNLEANEDVEDDEMEEDESLGGFIIDGSDVSFDDEAFGESEDMSDGNMDFEEILSKIRRNRDDQSKWEFEADMLAAFGKDPVLCMKAVCALYRQQTSEEKCCKGAIYANQRGFSQCDAFRGTTLAEFLTDIDPKGDLKKSVEELEEYDPKGLEVCRKLATHYSKQLFAIYKNKEDPLFLPD